MSKIYEQLCVMHKQKKNTGPSGKKAYHRWLASLFLANHTNVKNAMAIFDDHAKQTSSKCTSIIGIAFVINRMVEFESIELRDMPEPQLKTAELLESVEVYVYKNYYFAIKFSDAWRFQIGLMSNHVLYEAPVHLLNHLLPRGHRLSVSLRHPFLAPLGFCEWFIGWGSSARKEDNIFTREEVIECCEAKIDDIITLCKAKKEAI